MSIVNGDDVRIFPAPKRNATYLVKSPRLRARNRRWLERLRSEGLSIRDLARRLRKPAGTIARALRWAEIDEERREAEAVMSPVVDRISGLTEDEVLYLAETYGPDTELGQVPAFWAYLGPLVDEVLASTPAEPEPEPELVAASAA